MSDRLNIPLIEAVDVKKYFKVQKSHFLHAVDGINFRIDEGRTLGVVGESGCGKSTLGTTVIRLEEPTSGQVLFRGEDIFHLNKAEMRKMRAKMNIIFQDPYSSLDPRMTVAESIMEPMFLTGAVKNHAEAIQKTQKLMEIVGLASRVENAYPHELDGGRRQRVGIARTLSVNPEFVVCDEPVSALDVSIQAQILNLLMDLQKDMGLTYLFISHNLAVVKHISDEIMVMYCGVCVEQAITEELFQNPLHPYTLALMNAIPIPRLESIGTELALLKGEVSSPIDPPKGCRFAKRCGRCTAECMENDIPLTEINGKHKVACIHYEKGESK